MHFFRLLITLLRRAVNFKGSRYLIVVVKSICRGLKIKAIEDDTLYGTIWPNYSRESTSNYNVHTTHLSLSVLGSKFSLTKRSSLRCGIRLPMTWPTFFTFKVLKHPWIDEIYVVLKNRSVGSQIVKCSVREYKSLRESHNTHLQIRQCFTTTNSQVLMDICVNKKLLNRTHGFTIGYSANPVSLGSYECIVTKLEVKH